LVPLIGSLSLDTFAVSLAVGLAPLDARARTRFAALCVLSEGGMPLIGFALGGVAGKLGGVVTWLGVALLLAVGLWMAREALEDEDEVAEALERAESGGRAMVLAALSVGLDELAVGVGLGALGLPIIPVVLAIAVQALVASVVGLRLGARLGERVGRRAALLAGIALCAAALWLAVGQIAGWG
jgi:putative Mn2+ efflux pump MntP